MIKILTIIGARPQFVKAAAISRVIRNQYEDKIHEVLLHTGQHYDKNMSDVFFKELGLPKEDYNLQIGSGSHGSQTGKMMIAIEEVVLKEKPDAILLYGDTNSTLAGSLVAVKLHIPIIHVEGGVRFYKKKYPEEVNRIICDHMSSLIFVPSDDGMRALKEEGFKMQERVEDIELIDQPRVYRCGDIMYDNTLHFKEKIQNQDDDVFARFDLPKQDYVLVTMHRPSNVDQYETLENITRALRDIAKREKRSIILPLHPRTKHTLSKYPDLEKMLDQPNIHIIPAASFVDFLALEMHSDLIITDSGGVQKEAYFLEKPCLIMLEETPWVELTTTGTADLVGSDYEKLVSGANKFLNLQTELTFEPLYGDGKSSEFIMEKIYSNLA